jgi:hypothetical protein
MKDHSEQKAVGVGSLGVRAVAYRLNLASSAGTEVSHIKNQTMEMINF